MLTIVAVNLVTLLLVAGRNPLKILSVISCLFFRNYTISQSFAFIRRRRTPAGRISKLYTFVSGNTRWIFLFGCPRGATKLNLTSCLPKYCIRVLISITVFRSRVNFYSFPLIYYQTSKKLSNAEESTFKLSFNLFVSPLPLLWSRFLWPLPWFVAPVEVEQYS